LAHRRGVARQKSGRQRRGPDPLRRKRVRSVQHPLQGDPMILECPVSIGEVVDKITILNIKCEKIKAQGKRDHAARELAALEALLGKHGLAEKVEAGRRHLDRVNRELWGVEDRLRDHEEARDFGAEFVRLARSVYVLNDQRFRHKAQINGDLGSDLVEVKSYK